MDPNFKTKNQLNEIVGALNDLPSLPANLNMILSRLEDEDAGVEDICRVLGKDISLVARTLKIVNSAFYGFPRRIESLSWAVTTLGYNTIRQILLTASVVNYFKALKKAHGFQIETLWQHSISVATASQALAKTLDLRSVEEYFLAGLLHDIGKIALLIHMKNDYIELILNAKNASKPLYVAEQEILGFTHQDLGRLLAESWNLPLKLTSPIAFHHQPGETSQFFKIVGVVHVGDILAFAVSDDKDDPRIPDIDRNVWASLKLSSSLVMATIADFRQRLDEANNFWAD